MIRVFRNYETSRTERRSEHLRRAMVDLINEGEYTLDDGRSVFSYGHPLFWAPFIVVGDGG